jgi:hypothetical protein
MKGVEGFKIIGDGVADFFNRPFFFKYLPDKGSYRI